MFMWDACKDLTLVILMVAAAASLALGIKSEVRFTGKVICNSLYLVESVDSGLLSVQILFSKFCHCSLLFPFV